MNPNYFKVFELSFQNEHWKQTAQRFVQIFDEDPACIAFKMQVGDIPDQALLNLDTIKSKLINNEIKDKKTFIKMLLCVWKNAQTNNCSHAMHVLAKKFETLSLIMIHHAWRKDFYDLFTNSAPQSSRNTRSGYSRSQGFVIASTPESSRNTRSKRIFIKTEPNSEFESPPIFSPFRSPQMLEPKKKRRKLSTLFEHKSESMEDVSVKRQDAHDLPPKINLTHHETVKDSNDTLKLVKDLKIENQKLKKELAKKHCLLIQTQQKLNRSCHDLTKIVHDLNRYQWNYVMNNVV